MRHAGTATPHPSGFGSMVRALSKFHYLCYRVLGVRPRAAEGNSFPQILVGI